MLNDGTRDIFYHAIVKVTKEYYEKNSKYFITIGDNGVEELNIIKSLEGDVLKGITLVRLPIVTKNSLKNEDSAELLDAIKNKLLSLVDDSDKSSDSDTNDDDDENNGGKVN